MAAVADDFIEVDWTAMENDTVLPYETRQIVLGSDCQRYEYEARVEYPELQLLSEDQIVRWNIQSATIGNCFMPELESLVGTSRDEGFLDIGFVPIVFREGRWYRIMSYQLVVDRHQIVGKAGSQAFAASSSASDRYTRTSVLAGGRWYKIRVSESGVHKLTRNSLAQMGFNDPSKVRLYGYGGTLLPETGLEDMIDDLSEIPLWRVGGELLFYARGPLSWSYNWVGSYEHRWNTYSSYGYYFLTADDAVAPMDVPVIKSVTEEAEMIETTPDYALYEKDAFSWFHGGRRFFDEYDFALNASQTYHFELDDLADGPVTLNLSFSASGSVSSTIETSVNGRNVGMKTLRATGESEVATVVEDTYDCSCFVSGDNSVQLFHRHQDGVSGRLDYIRLNYRRKLVMHGSQMRFNGPVESSNVRFRISVPETDVVIWRLGNDGSIAQVPSDVKDGICTTHSVFHTYLSEYVAVDVNGKFPEPERVGLVPNQNLHGMDSIDMVVIVPSGGRLTPQAERLAEAHRQIDGMSVAVVPAELIYNEFSSGTPDATAYRRFLKMLYDRSPKLQYLLLFGNSAWDNRMLTRNWRGKSPDDYLLCYESDNSVHEIKAYVADDYFALLGDGKGGDILKQKVDIGVGRFPVSSPDEARIMVDKTIAYMNGEGAGDWQNTVLALGDDGDNNIHMHQADVLSEQIKTEHPELNVRKLYWDSYKMESSATGNSYPELRAEILRRLDSGALLVNYSGHGSPTVLSHESVLGIDDFSSVSSPGFSLWVTATCDFAPFDSGNDCLGRRALLNGNGCAWAMFTTTRSVYSRQNEIISNLFNSYVLDSTNRLGDAVRKTKVKLVTSGSQSTDFSENKLNYVLLGDPAVRLSVPEYRVVIDSMITDDRSGDVALAAAGGKVRVAGHIEDKSGHLADNYVGSIYPTVFDSRTRIVGRNNLGSADTCFSYYDYDRELFSGRDSVRNGRFLFEFPVPKDIRYSDENGRVVCYSLSDKGVSANGSFSDFIVGGTSSHISSDTIGPRMSLCLNRTDFQYWDKVNSSPCLLVELEDEDGINVSCSGTGHDMMLIIDDNTKYSYVLNNYYTPVDGDYCKGRIVFRIPELPEGRHTLMLRAWDVLNNSSTAYLGFETVFGTAPGISSVTLTENPVSDRTSFVITHDRPGSLRSVSLQVTDVSGRTVWESTSELPSQSGTSIVDWDACSNSGQRLQKGLYIYKVTITDSDGASESCCDKLVIL